jgi:hypothetical protein
MDDIIAEIYDKNGNKINMSLKDCYRSYLDVIGLLYHDYMVRVLDGDFPAFKKMHMKSTSRMIDMIHARFADHVEGIRMEFLERNNISDPRRTQLDG